ncbi:hypothetical protein E2C01_028009 [Portunus trituberculatus]|uniref:Uncharacterized protein n=1 Tax=Portunus trituberculatus TaxID=210409 RepID=A0A5B7EQG5_PORTR|nr:hypothetical protein [Portunus trituberculatus]
MSDSVKEEATELRRKIYNSGYISRSRRYEHSTLKRREDTTIATVTCGAHTLKETRHSGSRTNA